MTDQIPLSSSPPSSENDHPGSLSKETTDLIDLVATAISNKVAQDLTSATQILQQSLPSADVSDERMEKHEEQLDEVLDHILGRGRLNHLGLRKTICVDIRLFPFDGKYFTSPVFPLMHMLNSVVSTSPPKCSASPAAASSPSKLIPGRLIQAPHAHGGVLLQPSRLFTRAFTAAIRTSTLAAVKAQGDEVCRTFLREKRLYVARHDLRDEDVCLIRVAEEDHEWLQVETQAGKDGTGKERKVVGFGWKCGDCGEGHEIRVFL